MWTPVDFLKRGQAKRVALGVCQPWFYLRLAAYSFFRLSEGAYGWHPSAQLHISACKTDGHQASKIEKKRD